MAEQRLNGSRLALLFLTAGCALGGSLSLGGLGISAGGRSLTTVDTDLPLPLAPSGFRVEPAVGHDFGTVDLDRDPNELEHRFTVVNDTSAARRLEDVTSSCGCTVGTPDRMALAPGEALQLIAMLSVRTSRVYESTIWLRFDDETALRLSLRAHATRALAIRATVLERDHETVTISLRATSRNGPPPPELRLESGGQIEADDGWQPLGGGDHAVHWKRRLRLRSFEPQAKMTIGGDTRVRVELEPSRVKVRRPARS